MPGMMAGGNDSDNSYERELSDIMEYLDSGKRGIHPPFSACTSQISTTSGISSQLSAQPRQSDVETTREYALSNNGDAENAAIVELESSCILVTEEGAFMRGFQSWFDSWGDFFSAVDAHCGSTYQLLPRRSSYRSDTRNKKLTSKGVLENDPRIILVDSFDKYSYTLMCTHGIKKRATQKGKRQRRIIRYLGCTAQVNGVVTRNADNEWKVHATWHGSHNHLRSERLYQYYAENRRIKDPQVLRQIADMKSAGADAKGILDYLRRNTAQVFAAYLSDTRKGDPATLQHLEELAQLFNVSEWETQKNLFQVGERSNAWFVLLRGTVELLTIPTEATLASYSPKSEQAEPTRFQDSFNTLNNHKNQPSTQRELVGRVRPGCIFGDMDFMLEQPRVMDATSTAADTLTCSFTRKEMVELRDNHPELALLLHEILLRASYMTLAEKLHSLAI
ncbi:hypothetical protein PPTG_24290 [Phytophthora nicotianae INRA-310]|uniref:Cyclic nucleotide-binding domain-containing protein n=1 Tax=Phytophthora nicotianae (strain INRA-310) TaxID=761204 RepID=W2PH73_PHYN3|nr:hypothetical protein PPTG_24290 [Phytophthora nicotianae INRA-310]ETN00363.1 hypothetical protein PPTG_24290 [Phytophthora nicotianae INRA-310]